MEYYWNVPPNYISKHVIFEAEYYESSVPIFHLFYYNKVVAYKSYYELFKIITCHSLSIVNREKNIFNLRKGLIITCVLFIHVP